LTNFISASFVDYGGGLGQDSFQIPAAAVRREA
jgi:hypothetical protein